MVESAGAVESVPSDVTNGEEVEEGMTVTGAGMESMLTRGYYSRCYRRCPSTNYRE